MNGKYEKPGNQIDWSLLEGVDPEELRQAGVNENLRKLRGVNPEELRQAGINEGVIRDSGSDPERDFRPGGPKPSGERGGAIWETQNLEGKLYNKLWDSPAARRNRERYRRGRQENPKPDYRGMSSTDRRAEYDREQSLKREQRIPGRMYPGKPDFDTWEKEKLQRQRQLGRVDEIRGATPARRGPFAGLNNEELQQARDLFANMEKNNISPEDIPGFHTPDRQTTGSLQAASGVGFRDDGFTPPGGILQAGGVQPAAYNAPMSTDGGIYGVNPDGGYTAAGGEVPIWKSIEDRDTRVRTRMLAQNKMYNLGFTDQQIEEMVNGDPSAFNRQIEEKQAGIREGVPPVGPSGPIPYPQAPLAPFIGPNNVYDANRAVTGEYNANSQDQRGGTLQAGGGVQPAAYNAPMSAGWAPQTSGVVMTNPQYAMGLGQLDQTQNPQSYQQFRSQNNFPNQGQNQPGSGGGGWAGWNPQQNQQPVSPQQNAQQMTGNQDPTRPNIMPIGWQPNQTTNVYGTRR